MNKLNKEQNKKTMYELIDRWQCSKLSQNEFCGRENITRYKLRYWITRRNKELNICDYIPEQEAKFSPIKVSHSYPPVEYQLIYPNGTTLKCPDTIDLEKLKQLIHLF